MTEDTYKGVPAQDTVAGREENPLEYNTEREPLKMSEYGRNVLKMVEHLREIPDRQKRTEQARAIVKVMEQLNPSVRSLENWEHKLWDQLYMIADFNLDIDSPYAPPVKEEFETKPVPLPMKDTRIRASHYGRNIEKILDLIAAEPDGEVKTRLIHDTAVYMRQQYLIWNKDSVSDETIFSDIEKLSEYKIKVPEGMTLAKISDNADFSRPGLSSQQGKNKHKAGKKGHRR